MNPNDTTKPKPSKFLTKEEELALGVTIQRHFKAKERLAENEDLLAQEPSKRGKKKPLTEKEIATLEREVQEGELAVENLVKANMGLVYDRARIFKFNYPKGPEFEDLVQEGMTGLMTAVKKYDPDRGNKFSTVAYYWIAQAVGRGVNKTGRLVRLPENRINENTKINRIVNSPAAEGLSPTELDDLIMSELGISKDDLRNIRNAAATPASLNKVISSENGSSRELIDFVSEQQPTASSESTIISVEMKHALRDALNSLDDVKREIIVSTFNLHDERGCDPEVVRLKHDIPVFRFKRMHAEAMGEMKDRLTSLGFTFNDFSDKA